MNRRKVCSLSAAFLLGIAAVTYQSVLLWCILILYGIAWIYAIKKAYHSIYMQLIWILLFAAAVFAGSYDCCRQNAFRKAYESKLCDNEKCLVQGEIYKREQDNENYLYYLKDCKVQLHQEIYSSNQILLNLKTEEYSIGEILCVKGNIKTFALPRNEGNYNERAYYQSLKIDFSVEGKEVVRVYGKKCVYKEKLYSLREKMKNSFTGAMPKADAGVLTAMILGDKSLMDTERKAMYQDAGISHFYSISGLHISMLGMALYYFLRNRGCSYLFSGVIGAVLIISYGELIGYGISANRAIGMFLLLLYAKFRGRSYDRATALSLMAAVLSGKNPGLLQNAGFLLSFGAVAGVVLAEQILASDESGMAEEENREQKEKITGIVRKCWRSIKKSTRETFVVSVCIQIVTIPVMCQFFYEISVYSVFINLIILPCMGALLGMGISGGAAGCFFPFLGKCILFPCYLILLLFEVVCKGFLGLPGAVLITGKMSIEKGILWYVLAAAFFLGRRYWKKLKLFFLFVPLGFLLLFQRVLTFEIDVLDVGQGDGIYIATGDGTDIFIDGGSTDVSKTGIYRILPFLKYKGIREIDYWFVSHCDADHISGLTEVMDSGYPIKNLVVSAFMPEDDAWQELKAAAEKNKSSILKMKAGDLIKSENKNPDKNFCIQCLSPESFSSTQDRNANSMVLLYESQACTGFFGGDIGEAQEKRLVQEYELPKIDVYKASHHGSNSSNCLELLQELQPELTVISCGLKNSYGHPGQETLKRLKQVDTKIYETRYLGQIKIKGVHLEAEITSMLK